MDRIAILGCGGSGKTYLARVLARQLDLPLTHLDAIYYDADWNPMPREEFAEAQQQLVAKPRWVIEGNYASTLPVRLASADAVVVLDLPARTCLRGIAQRRLRHRGGQHKDIGVYNRINWSFIRYILGYRRTMLPRVHRSIGDHAHTAEVIVLRSRFQARRFLRDMATQQTATATQVRQPVR